MAGLADTLALAAIISDPDFTKKSLHANINGVNPNRLDCGGTWKLSGNTKIKAVDLQFGFQFGSAALVA